MNFLCWWRGHNYDKTRYRSDLLDFHFAHRKLPLMSRKEIENFYDNPPHPWCLRCKKEIK